MKNANPVSRELSVVIFSLWVLLLAGCGNSEPTVAPEPKTVKDWFDISVGDKTVSIQLALSDSEMQQGLMGRKDLKLGQGMMFIYPYPTVMSFWMRNTPTALDIGYFSADGILREIYPLHPFDERPVQSKREDLLFALEVLQGGYAEMGIKPGAQLDLDSLRAAVVARGYDPSRYRGLGERE